MEENQNKLTIESIMDAAHENAKSHGFWEHPLEFGTQMALVHSEISEALEADRKGHYADNGAIEYALELLERNVGMFNTIFESRIKNTAGDELADAIIRICDTSKARGIDLGKHIRLKMAYNSTRPYKHGKKY